MFGFKFDFILDFFHNIPVRLGELHLGEPQAASRVLGAAMWSSQSLQLSQYGLLLSQAAQVESTRVVVYILSNINYRTA